VVVPIAANPEPPRGLPQLIMLFRYRQNNQQSHHTALERFRQVIQLLNLL